MVARLFGKVPFRNQTIWLPGHLLSRLNERDGLSGGAGTGGAVSHIRRHPRNNVFKILLRKKMKPKLR